MKKRFLLFALVLAFSTFTSRAQIYQYYSQNFETGYTVNYTLSSATHATTQTSIVSGGSRALKMTHTQSNDVTITLDTIDFSGNASLNYFTLEFMQLAFVDPRKCANTSECCIIEMKRPDQTLWTQLGSTHYNMAEGGSTEFQSLSSFSKYSYSDWSSATAASNQLWHSERFDIEQIFQGVATTDKKLQIRFTLKARTQATSTDAWYLDDIKVNASSQQIITPSIQMRSFPDVLNYPSSRGAKLVCDVTTTALQGINGDSVFCCYHVGNRSSWDTVFLHRQSSGSSRFEGRIPFYGYDTLMHYHIVAKDATVNNNTVYFPRNASQLLTYRCVRGRTNTGQMSGTQTNNSAFPFPPYADNRSEFVYDSATMAQMGFGPGYIKDFRFILTSAPSTTTRPHLQFRMANASNTTRTATQEVFNTVTMQIVYDSSFTIEQAAAGSYKNVTLQDTFFYAGGDIIMQCFYDGGNTSDPPANAIKHVPVASGVNSLFVDGFDHSYEYDALGSNASNFEYGITTTTRPWIQFYETKNIPLIYDCGVSGFSYPSYETPCHVGTDSVVVWLKNFGVSPMNSIRLWYRIDNQTAQYHDWTGTLNGGDSVRVHLNDNQTFTVGYHTITAWVDDSILVGSTRFRDHEPYNDTCTSPFASCDGAYSGVRTVGTGTSAHFATLEKCLYALSRCGVDGPLTIKLPAGNYDVTKFPYIPGTSETNYVLFEPATSTAVVNFRRHRQGDLTNAENLVDLTEARSVRFNRINFYNGRYTDNRCDKLVQLGSGSTYCQFDNCSFVDSNAAANSCSALMAIEDADSVLVHNCTFYGGVIGADVAGPAPDIRANHNTIQFNDFANQVNTAISVVNQNDVWVDSNFINDVQTNASYVLLGQYCYDGSRITRNRIFSSKGACCLGVSDMHGTASEYCLVANNMLVSLDDGTTNLLTTPLNIIKGSYIKVVFNSVRMNAPSRVNIAAATFGGDVISNSYFQNNVIASFDTTNYAFSFIPGSNSSTLHVDHNCYYSMSGVINKLSGTNYTSLNNWRAALPSDLGSVFGNPNYTNGSVCRVDLRSFNSLLRNVGTPVSEVTIDLFGSSRDATHPSLGAYEVTALSIDFTPVEFITPLEDYCGAPSSIPVEVAIRNTGNGNYTYTSAHPINVYYSIDNGAVQSFTINRDCGPNDTIHFRSTRTMSLPYGSNNSDRTYNIRWWVKCNQDPDDLNDTNTWTVLSRYAAPAATVINQNVNYNTAATITPTAGINTWPVSYYTSGNGRSQRSGISWYHNIDDTSCFYYGPSLTTSTLFDDTTFYISQKRNLPLVKITEVQVSRTNAGATNPMPSWLNSSTFAVELTNCGDYVADLEGDSVIVVQPTSAAKIWVLPRVSIQPGENLILQFRTSTAATDSTRTICSPSTATVSPAYTANFGVIYRDGHGVADAVAFNNVISAASTQAITWSNQSIPAAVWQGSAIDLAKNGGTVNTPTAGARRISWPTNATTASPTASATLWQVATATNTMQMGETESNLIRYFDNGCEGARSAVNLHIINRPTCDLAVDEPIVSDGCNLTTAEPVTVTVHNYGAQTSSAVILKYSLDGGVTTACVDTLPALASLAENVHTFSRTINMHAGSDTTYHLKVWVDAISTDAARANDTSYGEFLSLYTPELPYVASPDSVDYGDTMHLVAQNVLPTEHVIWYNANHQVLDTTVSWIATPYIYHPDTFYYQSIALKDEPNTHVGNLTSATGSTSYPSPYNPKTRYVREQYIYTAEQIRAAGHDAGTISSISFFLNAMGSNVTEFTYDYYTIKMGTTTQSVFSGNTPAFITSLNEVYSASNLTFTTENLGWNHHKFDTEFVWDGTSNIVVEVVRALSTAGPAGGASTRYTTMANTVLSKQNATTDQATQATGSKSGNRPDIMFGFLEPIGCTSELGTVYVDVLGVPQKDATIDWATDPSLAEGEEETFNSCGTSTMYVNLQNMGRDSIGAYTLRYKVDNNAWQQTTGNANNLPLSYSVVVPLLNYHFSPGRHVVTAVVNVTGDTINSNDTISRTINVRFCGGNYTVGTCTTSDFATLTQAIDTLHNAGVAGAVVFDLCPQTYNEQLTIGNVPGANDSCTITFRTQPGSSQMATITHTPTNASNYVMYVNGANYVTFDSINFYADYTTGSGSNIYANVAQVDDSRHITFRNSVLRSKKSASPSTNANVLVLGDAVSYITLNNCIVDSGYYGIRTKGTQSSDNINITNTQISNFWFQGIYLRNTDSLSIVGDSITAGVTTAGKPLTGIYLANVNHASIQRNFVYLTDMATGGKRGIVLNKCRGTNMDRVTVYNNMISVFGTAVASLSSSGIWVDSLSKNINVYYNTARLYAGNSQPATRTFSVQNSSNIHSFNNIFDNASLGYAAYVTVDTCIGSSNFNVYHSNAVANVNTGARKFVHWGVSDCPNLDSLRIVNSKDPNSMEDRPYYENDTNDLRLTLAQFSNKAQYNPDVTLDVFGNIRPQIPKPTIGAFEFNFRRVTHDVTVAEIQKPYVPLVTTGNNPTVLNIETDSILVVAKFYNNGTAAENNCTWYAYMANITPESTVRSVTRTISRINAQDSVIDSVRIASPLGVLDTQHVVVVLNIGAGVTDQYLDDNRDTAGVFIYPAYDLKLTSIAIDTANCYAPLGCRMYATAFNYTITNAGKKDFPGNFPFQLGYDYYCYQPTNISMPNFPGSTESASLTLGTALPVGTSTTVALPAESRPNLYPTGQLQDLTVKFRGWVSHEYDIKPLNDTTAYRNITSNHTPEDIVVHDTMVDYGSFANLWATQSESRVIRWGRDTTSGNYFYNGNNNYARSTHWNTLTQQYGAPLVQYFHDSTYYVSCVSSKSCTSYYTPINVGINPPLSCDVSISEVRSPRASGRVYQEKDTVTLRVVNYGGNPVSNIPIAFKWMNSNGRTTYLEVHDTIRATIPARVGDNVSYYDFSFDTALLNINQPLTSVTYTLNAWVYHPNDLQRKNDTISSIHTFRTLPENTYDSINAMAPTSVDGFDITRVSFNEIDNEMPDLIGYDNLWLGNYNPGNAEVRTLIIRPGTTDTLTVEVANNQNEDDYKTAASLCVAIDYNRDGRYNFDGVENITKNSFGKGVKVRSRVPYKLPFRVPGRGTDHDSIQYGYMRMLVWVDGDSTAFSQGLHNATSHSNGQMQQYLLYIAEDCMLDSFDAALTRVVSPRNHIVTDTDHFVSIMLANNGSQPLTAATISYSFDDHNHIAQSGNINWSGNLAPGKSEVVRLDSIDFYQGTTDLTATVTVEGDTNHVANNTLLYQYHRYYVETLRFIDSFDLAIDKWYAPAGYNNYTRNFWQRGIPAKSNISSAYSQPNAYVTDCTQSIVTGKRGNRSELYTPIINIRQIRPDTITFVLSKNMAQGSFLKLEYYDYEGHWQTVDFADARWGAENNTSWYDEEGGWTGSTRNGEYVGLTVATNEISGNFGQDVQFRFVYTTPTTASSSSAFGDGAAVDNFHIGRAQRSVDVGVTAITYPTAPQFGQTIYPRVNIHNYGYDSINNFIVSYRPYGVYLPMEAICTTGIPSGGDIEFEFPDPFVVTNSFPDTFQICAFTDVQADIYYDNDTTCDLFALAPLSNDLWLHSIISPLASAPAGDSLDITVRLRNFGQNDIEECDVYYVYNEGTPVHEHIRFSDYLGRGLASTEYFNYTFNHHERVTMGTMSLSTWCHYDQDTYPYNDTVSMNIAGVSSITDLRATYSLVDDRAFDTVMMMMVIDNVGGRVANDFKVGYYYDLDTNTRYEEILHVNNGIAAGQRLVYTFTRGVGKRSTGWPYLTTYLSVPGDDNQDNDTTSVIVDQVTDLSFDYIEVEENMSDSCRVRAVVTNRGTITYLSVFNMRLYINGQKVDASGRRYEYQIGPGETRRIAVIDTNTGNWKKVLKNPNREYVGSGSFTFVNNDADATNNQTTVIRVLNYFEGVPEVENPDFVLEQNYPNPYEGTTRIEFSLPYDGNTRFFVTDVVGRKVYEQERTYSQGRHTIDFNGDNLPSGVYYYGLEFDGARRMHKMIIK